MSLCGEVSRKPVQTVKARLPVRSQREPVLIDLALQGGGNPLNKVLAESVDFARLSQPPIKLFITATNLRTGRGRVFRNAGLRA